MASAADQDLNDFNTASPIIASVSFTDIASGTSYLELFGCQHTEETTDSYLLTTKALLSQYFSTTAAAGDAWAKVLDLDFDVKLLNTRTIDGDVYCNVPLKMSGNADSKLSYAICKLRMWDGATETELGSAQTKTLSDTTESTVQRMMLTQIAAVKQVIPKGNTIRMTVEVWNKRTNGTNNTAVGHDPAGRGEFDSLTPTKLTFLLPIDVNL